MRQEMTAVQLAGYAATRAILFLALIIVVSSGLRWLTPPPLSFEDRWRPVAMIDRCSVYDRSVCWNPR